MKTTLFILVFAVANAITAYGQQVFNNTSLIQANNRSSINFTLNKDVNTRFFRVEASNDKQNFEIIGRITPKGNSMLPQQYAFELPQASYKYYRVGRVGMNADMQYSQIVSAQQNTPQEARPTNQNIAPGTITQR